MKRVSVFGRFIRDLIDCRLAVYLGWGALGLIIASGTYTFLSVLKRAISGRAIPGDVEIPAVILPTVAAFLYTLTSVKGKHVMTDVVVRHFSPHAREVSECLQNVVAAVLFSIVTWQGVVHALGSLRLGVSTALLKVPVAPFEFTYAAAMGIFSLHLLIRGISLIQALISKKGGAQLSISNESTEEQ